MNMRVSSQNHVPTSKPVHKADALVLTCMDYRLIGRVADYMKARGLEGRYDQVILAGGAIGVMCDQTTHWAETFWQHVELAKDLHGVRRIIVIDHRDCGACKAFVGKDCADNRDLEAVTHKKWMDALADEIATRHPELDVDLLLMDLDGHVEEFGGSVASGVLP